MKNIKQKIFLGLIAFGIIINFFPASVNADLNLWGGQAQKDKIRQDLGYETTPLDPVAVVVNVIKLLLTFLGILAVILVLWAGWLWMTAGGNEDNIKKAKGLLINATIGLLIILAAFGIADWVLRNLTGVVTGTTPSS